MKYSLALFFFIIISSSIFSQELVSVNSGANSSNNLIYSVGEIYVLPLTDTDESNSGLIGALSRIAFFVEDSTSIGVIEQENIGYYPNPTSSVVYFDVANLKSQKVEIFNTAGVLVAEKFIDNNQVDLTELLTGTYLIQFESAISPLKIIKN